MAEENALTTGAGATSQKKSKGCRLKCDPAKLPDPPYPESKAKDFQDMGKDERNDLIWFFTNRKRRVSAAWLKNKRR